MTAIAPLVAKFFREHLTAEKGVSKNTITCYSYAFKFLCAFVSARVRRPPSELHLEDLDAPVIRDFLSHLEQDNENSVRTRNLRLTAIRSFMKFVEYEVPAALDQVRGVRAIATKRTVERLVNYLTQDEMNAVLDAPDPTTRSGVRDQAMLYLAFAGGLRVSELVGLRVEDLEFDGPYPSILVRGKGRKERRLPLWKEARRALQAWLAVRGEARCPEVFLSHRTVTMTCAGFSYILTKHVRAVAHRCPSLAGKRVSPHVLRHTCAMNTLRATRDTRKVALWLGHASLKSTEIYLRADPTEKLEMVEGSLPPSLRRGVFQVDDRLIAWLSGKKLSGVDPWPDPVKERPGPPTLG